jgi:hypothetical protein
LLIVVRVLLKWMTDGMNRQQMNKQKSNKNNGNARKTVRAGLEPATPNSQPHVILQVARCRTTVILKVRL